MLHHTGDFLSRCGSIFQIGVHLVEPVPVGHFLSGHYSKRHLLSVFQPRHSDLFGVKVVHTADEHAWMFAARCLN